MQAIAHGAGIGNSSFRQTEIGPPGEDVFEISFALAMAHKYEMAINRFCHPVESILYW